MLYGVRRGWIASLALALVAWAGAANALTIPLSEYSSDAVDPNDPIPTDPADLTATLHFDVIGTTLVLGVDNQSQFDITAIYFNASSDVGGLLLGAVSGTDDDAGWSLVTSGNKTKAAGYGTFDFMLERKGKAAGPGGHKGVLAGTTASFTFDVSGTGPVDGTDFHDGTSEGYLAAAKFQKGPGDDSAFGTVTPEPGPALLFAVGFLTVAAVRRPRSRRPDRVLA